MSPHSDSAATSTNCTGDAHANTCGARRHLPPRAGYPASDPQKSRRISQLLRDRGYSPLRVTSPANPHMPVGVAGKAPRVEWRGGKPQPWTAGHSPEFCDGATTLDANVGVLGGGPLNIAALDIDPPKGASDTERVDFSRQLLRLLPSLGPAGDTLWNAPAKRTRYPGSLLIPFRTSQPMLKRKAAGQVGAVELLAAGQQFIGHGIHPAGNEWLWRGAALWEVAAQALPVIDNADVEALLAGIVASGVLGPPRLVTAAAPRPQNQRGYTSTYPATARLNRLFDKHDGAVLPAVRELIAEIGAAGEGRHDGLVAIAGRLVHQGWADERIHRLLTPKINECFGEGDWTDHFQAALDHARRKHAGRLANRRSVVWTA